MNSPAVLSALALPALDNTFGAFLLGTFLSLVLYGVTLHQSYRYLRLYPHDRVLIKVFVACMFVVETFHVATCMHTCYYYLVTNYFQPFALLRGVWSIQAQSVICAFEVLLSQSFFARRAYLLRPKSSPIIALAVLFSLVTFGFGIAATVQGVKVHTFERFRYYTWMDSVAFGGAVGSDILTTGMLIMVLTKSHTGFKQTDHLIDRLTLYAVNTGLLTTIFNILALIFALVYPSNMIYFGIYMVATRVYANSILAVLNTRHSLAAASDADTSIGIHAVATQNETHLAASRLWNARKMPEDRSETVIELKTSHSGSV